MNIKKTILTHRQITDKVVEYWIEKYFDLQPTDDLDWEWVNGDVGSTFYFADYYIDFSTVLECLNKEVPADKFFSYYDWNLEHHPRFISLQAFVWGAAEIMLLELERSREAVENAKANLEIAIANHNEILGKT